MLRLKYMDLFLMDYTDLESTTKSAEEEDVATLYQ